MSLLALAVHADIAAAAIHRIAEAVRRIPHARPSESPSGGAGGASAASSDRQLADAFRRGQMTETMKVLNETLIPKKRPT